MQQHVLGIFQKVAHQGVADAQVRLGKLLFQQRAFHGGGEKGHGIALGPDIQLQFFGLLVDLGHAQPARNHLLHKLQAGVLLVFLGLQAEAVQVVLLFGLALDLFLDFAQYVHQGVFGHRFQQVALHPQVDGLAGVVEIVVPRQDDDFHVGEFPQHDLAQFQPVHKGHPDVGDQHVGLDLAQQGQRHLAVPGFARKLIPHLVPQHGVAQCFPDGALILNQKDPQYKFLFLPAYGAAPIWQRRTKTTDKYRFFCKKQKCFRGDYRSTRQLCQDTLQK